MEVAVDEIVLPCACGLEEHCPHTIQITRLPTEPGKIRLGVFKRRLKGDPEFMYFWLSPDSIDLIVDFIRKETP